MLFKEMKYSMDFMHENAAYVYEYLYSLPILSILQEKFTSIFVSLYVLWYIKAYLSRTELIVKEGSIMHSIADKLTPIHSGYRPTFWCFPAFLNTIASNIFQKCIKHNYIREILTTQDGGAIALDWANLDGKNKIVLLMLPGLTSSSRSNYVTHLVDEAVKLDCTAVVMNYRGIEIDLKTPRTYSATNLEDIDLVVNHIRDKYKEHKIFAVGTSLGGIKLGGYLAKHYDDCLISNAMIISAPMNPFVSCEELEKPPHFFTFNKILTRELAKHFEKNKHLFEEEFDCSEIAKCNSLRDFDSKFVAKQFGYESWQDYYKDASLDSKIQNIKVPTLFLNACDDMFSPERAFPLEKIKSNPYTAMVMTKYGGHISFCEGIYPRNCNYSCRLLKEYIKTVLDEI